MSGSAADPVSFMWADQTLCHKQSWDQFQMKRILTVYVLLLYFLIKKQTNKQTKLTGKQITVDKGLYAFDLILQIMF